MEKTYLDYAENDYLYFRDCQKQGLVANAMAYVAQNAAEKYLKYIIEEYDQSSDRKGRTEVLHTHSIKKLLDYIEDDMQIPISYNTRKEILPINGFYYSTRYPGDDSFFVKERDIKLCAEALRTCRSFTLELIKELEIKPKEQNVPDISLEEEIEEDCL